MFEGDVLMFPTGDGGEIFFKNGQPTMNGGLRTAVFLSLFGGNFADSGTARNKKTWWGNIDENDSSYRYISRFQYLSRRNPLVSRNLSRFEQAVYSDLKWMEENNVASKIETKALIVDVKKLALEIYIDSPTDIFDKYLINWNNFTVHGTATS